jgi:O-antigen/teichoic acid export membrane protein
MNNTILVKRNIATTIALQIVTIVCGFILPKLILSYFGSEVYGLTSSITQFLNYIQLLEGGLSGVIMAALYKPLADKDYKKVSGIIKATESFFRQIGLIYVIYVLLLALVYPIIVKTEFSYFYVLSLVVIIGISTFIQYFFSLTYRILINADRKGYIVSIANIIFLLVNLFITIIAFRIYPEIHLIKLINAAAFTIQPIIFTWFVKKNYPIEKSVNADKEALKQRWDGFGQNIAFFIHANTDIVILTFFSLKDVSVYSVYIMIVSAIKNLVVAISSAIAPSMGNVLVKQSDKEKNRVFDNYEFSISIITTVLFTCCILLIVPFVRVYTANISDANYIRPLFAVLITVAEGVYCIRSPFVNVAYAAGHFRETAKYAYLEAIINISISLVMVFKLGIVGVAIGTLVAMTFRMVAHVLYLKNRLIYRPVRKWLSNIAVFLGSAACAILIVVFFVKYDVTGYLSWFIYALIVGSIVVLSNIAFLLIFRKSFLQSFIRNYVLRS